MVNICRWTSLNVDHRQNMTLANTEGYYTQHSTPTWCHSSSNLGPVLILLTLQPAVGHCNLSTSRIGSLLSHRFLASADTRRSMCIIDPTWPTLFFQWQKLKTVHTPFNSSLGAILLLRLPRSHAHPSHHTLQPTCLLATLTHPIPKIQRAKPPLGHKTPFNSELDVNVPLTSDNTTLQLPLLSANPKIESWLTILACHR